MQRHIKVGVTFRITKAVVYIVYTALSAMFSVHLYALPQGASINGGQAEFFNNGSTLTVNQLSDKLSVNYDAFNIGVHEQVVFNQPSVDSIALNRVIGNNVSIIQGALHSNGHLFLLNPNGILFTESAHLDVGGILASTLNMSDGDFFSGNFSLSGGSVKGIHNQGLIDVAENGLLAMVSAEIINEGELSASEGNIELHASNQVLLDFSDSVVSLQSDSSLVGALIENHGLISASGGRIVLNADAKDALYESVINNSGLIQADSLSTVNGEVILHAGNGDLENFGLIDVSAIETDTSGGTVNISARRVAQNGDVQADGIGAGNGGNILVNAEEALLINSGLTSANGGETGDGGQVIYYAAGATLMSETSVIETTGGIVQGDGGFIEVSGLDYVAVEGSVNAYASNGEGGTFLIDPTNIEIVAASASGAGGAIVGGFEWVPDGIGTPSQIAASQIQTWLSGGNNVEINTARVDTGVDTGTLSVLSAIDLSGATGQTLSLVADDNMTISANICEGGATCSYTNGNANLILTTSGTFTVNDGVIIDSGTGTINISSTGDATVSGLTTRNTGGLALRLITNGAIADSGDTLTDITVQSGTVTLQAFNGINIDTDVQTLSLTNSVGGINISETDDLNLTGLNNNSDAIFSVGGTFTVPDLGIDLGANNLTILANDLVDVSGRSIDLAANTLTLSTQGLGADTTVNSDAVTLNAANSGANTLSVSDVDAIEILSIGSGGDVSVSAATDLTITTNPIELDGSNNQTITLSAGNTVSIGQNMEDTIGSLDNSTNFVVSAGNMIDMTSDTRLYAGNGTISMTSTVGNLHVADLRSTSSANNAIQIASGGEIIDEATGANFTAVNGGVVLTAQTGITGIELDASQLSITNSTSGEVIVQAQNQITLSALSATGTTARTQITNLSGDIILPNTINVVNALELISAGDIRDADRNLSFTTMDSLLLTAANPAGDLQLTTDLTVLEVLLGGSANLTVTEANDLTLAALDAGTDSISLVDGNVSVSAGGVLNVNDDITISNGNVFLSSSDTMNIDAAVAANDAADDEIRSGLIDLEVSGGDLNIGATGSASIISLNALDQDVSGGLDGEQASIRMRQTDSGTAPFIFSFGDNTGSDILIQAQGGDIILDSLGGNTTIDPTTRQIIANADTTIEAFNNPSDPATGIVSLNQVQDNGATIQALAGRIVAANEVVVVLPPPSTPPAPDVDQGLSDLLADTLSDTGAEPASKNSTQEIEQSLSAAERQVGTLFTKTFGGNCDSEAAQRSSRCKNNNALVSFLNAFIIGGEMPSK